MLSKEDWILLKHDDKFKEFIELLKEEKENIHANWELGNFLHDSLVNARMVGVLEGLNKAIFMEVEDEE